MPSKFIIKQYTENGIYHIYDRGVNKCNIFIDQQDYRMFLNTLKLYLLPKQETIKIINSLNLPLEEKLKKQLKITQIENFYNQINLFAFVLMPNHFHLLLRQKNKYSIKFFLKNILIRYAMYFNRKYNRSGPLFQTRYKAILVDKEEYLLHLSRYIHLNPKGILANDKNLFDYPWSSYPLYIKNYQAKWLNKDLILSYFSEVKGFGFSSYQGFVEGFGNDRLDIEIKKTYLID